MLAIPAGVVLAVILRAAAPAQDEGGDPFAAGGTMRLAVGNGLTALVVADPKAKDVALRLEVGGGAAADPAGKEGLAALALTALAGARSGAHPGGDVEPGPSSATLRVRFDAASFGPALGALAERLGAAGAGISAAAFDAAKKAAIERATAPGAAADRALAAALFGPGHPSARAWAGTPESLGTITIADAKAFFTPAVSASRSSLALVGPIVGVESLAEIPIRLAAWPGAKAAARTTPPIPRAGGKRAILVAATGPQHELRAAFLLPPRSDARLARAAAAAAVELQAAQPALGAAKGTFGIRIHGRPSDASVLVAACRVEKAEEAAAVLPAIERALAAARAAVAKGDGPIARADALHADLRAAIALLESNPDDDGTSSPKPKAADATAPPAIDLDSAVVVIAGPGASSAEAPLKAAGYSVEKR